MVVFIRWCWDVWGWADDRVAPEVDVTQGRRLAINTDSGSAVPLVLCPPEGVIGVRVEFFGALYRRPRTTQPEPGHKIYPYLLRGMEITRPNQVWAMDITYIPMARGFVYLAVVLDWFSSALKLSLPRCNLIGVDVELPGKLRQCPIAFQGGKRHLRLEGRCVVPARSSLHRSLLIRRLQRARRQAETPLIVLCRFAGPALYLHL